VRVHLVYKPPCTVIALVVGTQPLCKLQQKHPAVQTHSLRFNHVLSCWCCCNRAAASYEKLELKW
jgi:hypothetical protein